MTGIYVRLAAIAGFRHLCFPKKPPAVKDELLVSFWKNKIMALLKKLWQWDEKKKNSYAHYF